MEKPARAFIFDLDGTLADTMPSHYLAWTKVTARHGLTFPEARFYSLGGVPTEKIAGMLIAEAGLALDPMAVALEKEETYYEGLGAGGIVAIDPVLALARSHRELEEGPRAPPPGGGGGPRGRPPAAAGGPPPPPPGGGGGPGLGGGGWPPRRPPPATSLSPTSFPKRRGA